MADVTKTPVELSHAAPDMEQPKVTLGEQVAVSDGFVRSEVPSLVWRNWLNIAAYIVNTVVTYTSLTGLFGATNTELSKKYQTLVTPAGWAFSIWGLIFLWEGVFVVAQLFPSFRGSKVVFRMSPWWVSLCACQIAWTIAFAQDQVTVALVFMLSILASLLGISWSTDGLRLTTSEYLLLRAPLSLQLGWIIAASVVNVSVQADASQSSQEALLALAVVSNALVLASVAIFTFAVNSPDPLVGMVAAWAFAGIYSELSNPTNLNDQTRYNASPWNVVVLGGLRNAALAISLLSLALSVVAVVLRARGSGLPHQM